MSIAMPAPGDRNDSRLVGTQQMAQFWKERIRRALVGATSQQGMKATEPFTEKVMQGLPFFIAKSEDDQRDSFLSCYGLVGRGGAVFIITVEGWSRNKSTAEAAVVSMIKNICLERAQLARETALVRGQTRPTPAGLNDLPARRVTLGS